jgi:hypothetical protein
VVQDFAEAPGNGFGVAETLVRDVSHLLDLSVGNAVGWADHKGCHVKPVGRRQVQATEWRQAVGGKAGEVDDFGHDLRHVGGTLAAATGASLKELMARLGHSSTRAAMIYQHATRDRDEAIAKALGGLLDQVRSDRIDQAGGDR